MSKYTFLISLMVFFITACVTTKDTQSTSGQNSAKGGSEIRLAKNKNNELTCKMSTAEMHQRKITVLASLKEQMTERQELENGYAFKFPGTDKVLDELTEFIKTERECCSFFTFTLSVSGDKNEAWLTMTGVKGAKDFITNELGL